MTPGRPAAASPASRVLAARPSSPRRLSPRACSSIVASGWSSGWPAARASARPTAASLTPSSSPWPMLEALISCTLRQLDAGFAPMPSATTATAGSEFPVVADGHSRASALRPDGPVAGRAGARRTGRPAAAAQPDQPGGAVPVPLERLQQRQHLLVGRPVLAGQGPADDVLQVVVADRDRVRVARRPLPGLGRGPYPDAGDGPQLAVGLLVADLEQPLKRRSDRRSPDDRLRPDPLHPGPVPLPGRNAPPHGRLGKHPHPPRCRPGRLGPELVQQDLPRPVRLQDHDL